MEGTAHLQLHRAGWSGLGAQIRTREVSGDVSPAHVMKPGPGPGWVELGIASGWNQGQECWQQGWGSVSGHPQLPAHSHHHHLPRHLTLPCSPVPSPGENPGWPSAGHWAAGGAVRWLDTRLGELGVHLKKGCSFRTCKGAFRVVGVSSRIFCRERREPEASLSYNRALPVCSGRFDPYLYCQRCDNGETKAFKPPVIFVSNQVYIFISVNPLQ